MTTSRMGKLRNYCSATCGWLVSASRSRSTHKAQDDTVDEALFGSAIDGNTEDRAVVGSAAEVGCSVEDVLCHFDETAIGVFAIGSVEIVQRGECAGRRRSEDGAAKMPAPGLGGAVEVAVTAEQDSVRSRAIGAVEAVECGYRARGSHREYGAALAGSAPARGSVKRSSRALDYSAVGIFAVGRIKGVQRRQISAERDFENSAATIETRGVAAGVAYPVDVSIARLNNRADRVRTIRATA